MSSSLDQHGACVTRAPPSSCAQMVDLEGRMKIRMQQMEQSAETADVGRPPCARASPSPVPSYKRLCDGRCRAIAAASARAEPHMALPNAPNRRHCVPWLRVASTAIASFRHAPIYCTIRSCRHRPQRGGFAHAQIMADEVREIRGRIRRSL